MGEDIDGFISHLIPWFFILKFISKKGVLNKWLGQQCILGAEWTQGQWIRGSMNKIYLINGTLLGLFILLTRQIAFETSLYVQLSSCGRDEYSYNQTEILIVMLDTRWWNRNILTYHRQLNFPHWFLILNTWRSIQWLQCHRSAHFLAGTIGWKGCIACHIPSTFTGKRIIGLNIKTV